MSELQSKGVLLVEDGNHGENRPRPDEFVDTGVAFIRAADMDAGRVLFESASGINERARTRITKGIGAPGDVLLSHKGTVGKVALVPVDAPPFVCSPQTTFWRTLDEGLLDRTYLYAFLRSPGFRRQLSSRSGETDMAPYVSLTSQRGLSVAIPPMVEQRAIAHILGTLDDKIELNRRMSETLEAMARALFRSWFVDFDPVRSKAEGRDSGLPTHLTDLFPDSFEDSELGEIPRGWSVGPLLAQAQLLSGGTPKTACDEYWGGGVAWASAKDVSQCAETFLTTTERTITEKGLHESATQLIPALATAVVARGATTGRMVMFGRAMAMNQTCYALVSSLNTPFVLHCQFRDAIDRLVHAAHGSIFDTITTSTFESSRFVLPPSGALQGFERIVAPAFRRVLFASEESSSLAALRDTLLPKLISGELRVHDVGRFSAEIGGGGVA
ncbi:MAG: restriction endonuclease subunit S [bacterium]|nr:restriction endonuclease subunit S [bacterium]